MRSPGQRLLRLWRRLHRLPGGTRLFSLIFGWRVPYSRSVRPHIRVLAPGHAEVEIPDRRGNRQHLGSVHAVALVNLAEQTSGLALLTALPNGIRGIVTQISMQYFKKARGPIRAVCDVAAPHGLGRHGSRRDRRLLQPQRRHRCPRHRALAARNGALTEPPPLSGSLSGSFPASGSRRHTPPGRRPQPRARRRHRF